MLTLPSFNWWRLVPLSDTFRYQNKEEGVSLLCLCTWIGLQRGSTKLTRWFDQQSCEGTSLLLLKSVAAVVAKSEAPSLLAEAVLPSSSVIIVNIWLPSDCPVIFAVTVNIQSCERLVGKGTGRACETLCLYLLPCVLMILIHWEVS